jgi:uncharacterized membrane protein
MIFNNKLGEITPRNFIFGFIIFTLIIISGITILTEYNNVKPGIVNDDRFRAFNETFNKYSDVISSGDNLQSGIEDSNPEKSIFGVLDSLINSAWGTLKSFFSTFSFMSTAFGGISVVFGIPSWVSALITTMILVMIAFSIYSLIFQGKA